MPIFFLLFKNIKNKKTFKETISNIIKTVAETPITSILNNLSKRDTANVNDESNEILELVFINVILAPKTKINNINREPKQIKIMHLYYLH